MRRARIGVRGAALSMLAVCAAASACYGPSDLLVPSAPDGSRARALLVGARGVAPQVVWLSDGDALPLTVLESDEIVLADYACPKEMMVGSRTLVMPPAIPIRAWQHDRAAGWRELDDVARVFPIAPLEPESDPPFTEFEVKQEWAVGEACDPGVCKESGNSCSETSCVQDIPFSFAGPEGVWVGYDHQRLGVRRATKQISAGADGRWLISPAQRPGALSDRDEIRAGGRVGERFLLVSSTGTVFASADALGPLLPSLLLTASRTPWANVVREGAQAFASSRALFLLAGPGTLTASATLPSTTMCALTDCADYLDYAQVDLAKAGSLVSSPGDGDLWLLGSTQVHRRAVCDGLACVPETKALAVATRTDDVLVVGTVVPNTLESALYVLSGFGGQILRRIPFESPILIVRRWVGSWMFIGLADRSLYLVDTENGATRRLGMLSGVPREVVAAPCGVVVMSKNVVGQTLANDFHAILESSAGQPVGYTFPFAAAFDCAGVGWCGTP